MELHAEHGHKEGKPYFNRDTAEDCIRAFENSQEDYLAVADTLGVNRSTARGIITTFVKSTDIKGSLQQVKET